MSDFPAPVDIEPVSQALASRVEPVLIVDDSAAVRKILRKMLGTLGINKVVELENVTALSTILKNPVKFIICDVEMQPISGLQFLSALRNDAELKNIPVLLITASRNIKYALAARNLSAEGFLLKPFSAEALRRAMVEVASRPGR